MNLDAWHEWSLWTKLVRKIIPKINVLSAK